MAEQDLPHTRISRRSLLRTATIGTLGGVSVFALAACGGQTTTPAASSASKLPVTLPVLSQTVEIEQLLPEATKRLPHITFEFIPAPGLGFIDKALTFGASGTPPPMHYANSRFLPALIEPGLLEDHNALAKREKLALTGVTKPTLEDLTWAGKLGALPMDVGYAFIQVNRTLFARSGQPDPITLWQDKKWTWDAFTRGAVALTKTGEDGAEQAGYGLRTWEGDYQTIIRTLGGDLLNKDRTKFILGEPAGLNALTLWGELVTKQRAATQPDKVPGGGFDAGRIAMYPVAPVQIGRTRATLAKATPFSWDTAPHPAPPGKKPIPTLFTQGFSLWKNNKAEAQTIEAARLLTGDEMMLFWGAMTGRDPANAALIDEHGKGLKIPTEDPKSYIKFAKEVAPNVRGMPHSVRYAEWHKILVDDVLLPIAAGQKNPQDAVRAATPRIDALLTR